MTCKGSPEAGRRRSALRRGMVLLLALIGAGVAGWLALRYRGPAILRPLARCRDPRFSGLLIPGRPQFQHPGPPTAREQAIFSLAEAYERIERDEPADACAWVDLNERLLWLGECPRAESGAQAMLRLVPDYPPALALLSGVRFFMGDWEEGAALAERALASRPDLPLALVSRARMAAARGDREAAFEDLRRAAKIDRRRPEASFHLGFLLFQENRFSEAAPHLRRAQEHQPDPDWPTAQAIRRILALEKLLAGRRPHRLSGPQEVEVPISLRGEVPAVWARLEGGVEGWFMIDTGTNLCTLSPFAVKGARIADDSFVGSAPSSSKAALLPRMEIGPLVIHDAPAVLEAKGIYKDDLTVLGLLGVSLLREFEVSIDLFRGRARFALRTRAQEDGRVSSGRATRVSCRIVDGRPFLRVRLGGGPERLFLFDTAAHGLRIDSRLAREDLGLDPNDPRAPRIGITSPGGRQYQAPLISLPKPLVIAGLALEKLDAHIDPLPGPRYGFNHPTVWGTLGIPGPGRYTIDLARHTITLDTRRP